MACADADAGAVIDHDRTVRLDVRIAWLGHLVRLLAWTRSVGHQRIAPEELARVVVKHAPGQTERAARNPWVVIAEVHAVLLR